MLQSNTNELNHAKLKEITNATHTSVVTMLRLAMRERARGFSNVTATKQQLIRMGEKIVDEDYIKFWQDLETAGIGSLIIGRRGNPDRFKWHYSLKEIARVAIEGKEEEAKVLTQKMENQLMANRKVKRGPGRPKGYSPKKRGPGRPKGFNPKKKRQRMSKEAKQIERRILQVVRQALLVS